MLPVQRQASCGNGRLAAQCREADHGELASLHVTGSSRKYHRMQGHDNCSAYMQYSAVTVDIPSTKTSLNPHMQLSDPIL